MTLLEMILAMVVIGVIATTGTSLLGHGLQSYLLLPNIQVTNQVALEIAQAVTEGSPSALVGGQWLPGLRFTAQQPANPLSQPLAARAIWYTDVSNHSLGYLIPRDPTTTADDQYVFLRLDNGLIKRSVTTAQPVACPYDPSAAGVPEEDLPYFSAGSPVQILPPPTGLFRYYNQGGGVVVPLACAGDATIRRVDMAFTAQTGSGQFGQSDAQVTVTSSVAIRFP